MAGSSRFDFCPKCGALARDGICQSCGYTDPRVIKEIEEARQAQSMQQPVPSWPQGGYMQQPYVNQSPYVYGQPFVNNQNSAPTVPPAQQKRNHSTLLVIIVLVVILILTCVVLFVEVNSILDKSNKNKTEEVSNETGLDGKDEPDEYTGTEEEKPEEGTASADDGESPDATEDGEEQTSHEETVAENEDDIDLAGYSHQVTDVTEQNRQEEGQDTSLPYYTGPYHALDDTLSYDISFVEEVFYADAEAEFDKVFLSVEYPQIAGESPYEDFINETLYAEYEYYHNFFTEGFLPLMQQEEDACYCEVDSYVTYMDEKILSVVFREETHLTLENDPFQMLNFYCVNIDLENGTILENTEILHMDEAFAADFRAREIAENGDEALTAFTDQEILEMLTDPAYLVAFYTPYGMEIGLNLDDSVVYVMYDDYENFLNIY